MGTRGKPSKAAVRSIGRLLLLLTAVLLAIAPASTAAAAPGLRGDLPADTADAPTTERVGITWTAEQAVAALTAAPVAQLPGSPAVLDRQKLTEAIGTSKVRILAVPFAQPADPTASRMDDATSDQLEAVRSWSYGRDVDLIAVVGLHITMGILEQRPDSVPDLQRIMVRSDMTQSLLFTIAYEQSGRDAADATEQPGELETPVSAEQSDTETIAAALAAEKYYAASGIEAPETPFADWQDVGPDRVVRVAMLAGPEPGAPLVDQLSPLAARFPDDIVVVATGRWVQMAGPEQDLLDSAVLYGYGAYYDRIAQNDLPIANLTLGMLNRVDDLRTGSVSGQHGPTTEDPVAGVSPALPWLFIGTALIVVAGLVLFRRRRTTKAADAARNNRRARSRATARLAVLSEQIMQIDGLARDSGPRDLVTNATERYGTARDLLVANGDLQVAQSALDAASDLLTRAAAELDVPLAGAGDRP